MSGFFGIFNRNNTPINQKKAKDLLHATSYWNPDECAIWTNDYVVLGHSMLWNTLESKHEHLPLKKTSYILTMDARIDNRDELFKEIELPDKPLSQIGDSEFILGAYKKWGEACPKYLLGDFSFAIWDEKKEQIFCARDHIGVKQFYYHFEREFFLFGNDLRVLSKYPKVSRRLNDEAVANYLANHLLRSDRLTFFESFQKLPPAHTLVVNRTELKEKCYWRLEDTKKVVLSDTDAYAKKLRELFEQAVFTRIRSDYPITSHLSGGLDSSSIAILSARKLKEKDEKLLAFNWVHEPSEKDDLSQEEWNNSIKVAKIEDIDHSYVTLSPEDICRYRKERKVIYGDSAIFWYEYPVRQAAMQKGSRTILSGWGGDEFATNHGRSYYSDLFLKRKWIKLFFELNLKTTKSNNKIKSFLNMFYHTVMIPLVPRKWYCKMPKIECFKNASPPVKKWFLKHIEREKERPSDLSMQPQRTIRKDMLAYWRHKHLQSRIESWSTDAISKRIEYRYPLLDKRILEFIISLPPELFLHNATRRYLFYLATKDLFPDDFNIQKISEPNRVKRLLEMILSSYRLTLKNDDITTNTSPYVDNDLFLDLLDQLTLSSKETKINWTIDDLETTLSLLMKEKSK